ATDITSSAKIFEQLKQTLRRILRTVFMNPMLRKLQVAKVTRALGHVSHTRLTLHLPINCPQTWVAQAPNFWLAPFRVTRNYDLIGTEYAKLDNADFGDLRRRKWEPQIHGVEIDDIGASALVSQQLGFSK
ncbi:P-loop nucleoside triphosphate hydrolasessuperfamily protein with CH (Calponin Homology) domain, partial [Striga asiatica]